MANIFSPLLKGFDKTGKMASLFTININAAAQSVAGLASQFVTSAGDAATFTSSVSDLSSGVGKTAPAIGILTTTLGKLAPILKVGATALGVLGVAFIAVKVAAAPVKLVFNAVKKASQLLVGGFKKLYQIGSDLIKSVFSKLVSVVRKLLGWLRDLSPAIEGIAYDFELLADRAGIGGEAMLLMMQKASSGMASNQVLMQQYNKAAQGVGLTFAETLPQALIYFGQISLATGESVDYLLKSYVRGVQKLSPLILDNLGIQVSMAEATAQAAFMFGKSADQLTRAEKQAGFYTVTLNKLAITTQGLPGPMGTLAQKIAAIETKFKNLKDTLVMTFLPAAKAVADLILGIMDKISLSGDTLKYVSATIQVIAEELLNLVNVGADAMGDFGENFTNKLISTASSALEWGAKIAVNLAIGIVEGGSRALIAAINWISNLLSYWLAPGSAPKILPDLLKWGAATFTEWLRGFQDADFDVLETVQSPLARALRIVTGDGEFGDTFEEITHAMASYIAGSSSLESAMAALASVGSGYGDELAILFQRMLSVSDATDAVAASEKRLADAQLRYKQNRKALIEGAREYNKLLRGGASQDILRNKMAQLKLNYKNMKTAEDQVEEEEDTLSIAKEQLKVMKEQASAQERLLNQILKMAEIGAADGGDGDGDGTFPGLPEFPDVQPVITSIDEAFDAIYAKVRARLEELWAMVVATWEASDAKALWDKVVETWETSRLKEWLTVDLPAWFQASMDRINEVGLWAWLKEELLELGGWLISQMPIWAQVIANWLLGSFGVIYTWMRDDLFAWVVKELDKWADWWDEEGPEITKAMDAVAVGWVLGFGVMQSVIEIAFIAWWNVMKIAATAGMEGIRLAIELGAAAINLDWGSAWDAIVGINQLGWDTLDELTGNRLYGSMQAHQDWLDDLGGRWGTFWNETWVPIVQGAWDAIDLLTDGALSAAALDLKTWWTNLGTDWSTFWSSFGTTVNDFFNNTDWTALGRKIKDGIAGGLSGIGDAVKHSMNELIWRVEQAVNSVIGGINAAIRALRSLPGAGWMWEIPLVNLPRLEAGGLFAGQEQLALLHGPEVVLPLNDPRTIKALSKAMGGAQQAVEIHNHFGRDSVRSDADIDAIANAIQKRLELRGVRGRL